jgi:hypothetical protein
MNFFRPAGLLNKKLRFDENYGVIGPCHVSGIFLPLRVNSLPLATIYEVKIPLRKWKKSLLQRNPAQMTWANVSVNKVEVLLCRKSAFFGRFSDKCH